MIMNAIDVVLQERYVGNVDAAFFWIRSHSSFSHAGRRRTRSISSYDELTRETKMVAASQRKYGSRVHLNTLSDARSRNATELRNNKPRVTQHVHVLKFEV